MGRSAEFRAAGMCSSATGCTARGRNRRRNGSGARLARARRISQIGQRHLCRGPPRALASGVAIPRCAGRAFRSPLAREGIAAAQAGGYSMPQSKPHTSRECDVPRGSMDSGERLLRAHPTALPAAMTCRNDRTTGLEGSWTKPIPGACDWENVGPRQQAARVVAALRAIRCAEVRDIAALALSVHACVSGKPSNKSCSVFDEAAQPRRDQPPRRQVRPALKRSSLEGAR
jgi:hypothetical protein